MSNKIKPTTSKDASSKQEIIKQVAELTGMSNLAVQDVLDAFVDICTKEIVSNGCLKYPGLPIVIRNETGETLRYQSDLDVTLKYPHTYQLRARVPALIKKLHREHFRSQTAIENNLPLDEWWKPFYYCDGDWRKKED